MTTAKALAVQQQELDAQQAEIKETQRKADLQASIDHIRMTPVDLVGASVADMQKIIDELGIINPVERYGDFAADATTAIEDTKLKIKIMLDQQKGIDDQMAEIERQSREQAAYDAEALRQEEEKAEVILPEGGPEDCIEESIETCPVECIHYEE